MRAHGSAGHAIGGAGPGGLAAFANTAGRRRGNGICLWSGLRWGFGRLDEVFRAAAQDQRPSDGYLVSFWRLLLKYPEVLGWEKLWTDSYHEVRQELYGMAKAIAPEKPFGFHIMQNMTFSPFYRAEEDYSQTKNYTDFLKLATYNNAGWSAPGRLSGTAFRHRVSRCKPEDFLGFYYKLMNYQGASYRGAADGRAAGRLCGRGNQAGDCRGGRPGEDLSGNRY